MCVMHYRQCDNAMCESVFDIDIMPADCHDEAILIAVVWSFVRQILV